MLTWKSSGHHFNLQRRRDGNSISDYLEQTKQLRRRNRCSAFKVIPYTPTETDTLESVSRSKGITTHELKSLNHELELDELDPSQSILIPQEMLSKEDRQILEHMISRSYRTYAVKEGETIAKIIESRQISREEIDRLNPDSDLENLATREIIKLPVHSYSAREEYESHGLLGARLFKPGGWFANTFIAGFLGISWYCLYLYKESKRHQQAIKVAQQKSISRKKYEVPNGMPLPSYMASVDETINGPLDSVGEASQSEPKPE